MSVEEVKRFKLRIMLTGFASSTNYAKPGNISSFCMIWTVKLTFQTFVQLHSQAYYSFEQTAW